MLLSERLKNCYTQEQDEFTTATGAVFPIAKFQAEVSRLSDSELLKLEDELDKTIKATKLSDYLKIFKTESILATILSVLGGATAGHSIYGGAKGALFGAGLGLGNVGLGILINAWLHKDNLKKMKRIVDLEIEKRGLHRRR